MFGNQFLVDACNDFIKMTYRYSNMLKVKEREADAEEVKLESCQKFVMGLLIRLSFSS